MQDQYLIELEDAVIAIKQPNGRIKLNQLYHPAAAGAAYGSLWGLLVGLIFMMPVPGAAVMPAAGAAVGAASGAIGGALADVGINHRFVGDVAATLQSRNAALFLLIGKVSADKALADFKGVARGWAARSCEPRSTRHKRKPSAMRFPGPAP
jgi:uncharacterized membrane protein